MIYHCEKNPPFNDAGCHVLDANGLEYFQVIEFDTETGRIVRCVTEGDGVILRDPGAPDGIGPYGETLTETIFVPASLIVKKKGTHGISDERHNVKDHRFKGCTCQRWVCSTCPVFYAHKRDRDHFEWLRAREEGETVEMKIEIIEGKKE